VAVHGVSSARCRVLGPHILTRERAAAREPDIRGRGWATVADETEPGTARYPEAPRGSVVDELHGHRIPDPYRWLKNTESANTLA